MAKLLEKFKQRKESVPRSLEVIAVELSSLNRPFSTDCPHDILSQVTARTVVRNIINTLQKLPDDFSEAETVVIKEITKDLRLISGQLRKDYSGLKKRKKELVELRAEGETDAVPRGYKAYIHKQTYEHKHRSLQKNIIARHYAKRELQEAVKCLVPKINELCDKISDPYARKPQISLFEELKNTLDLPLEKLKEVRGTVYDAEHKYLTSTNFAIKFKSLKKNLQRNAFRNTIAISAGMFTPLIFGSSLSSSIALSGVALSALVAAGVSVGIDSLIKNRAAKKSQQRVKTVEEQKTKPLKNALRAAALVTGVKLALALETTITGQVGGDNFTRGFYIGMMAGVLDATVNSSLEITEQVSHALNHHYAEDDKEKDELNSINGQKKILPLVFKDLIDSKKRARLLGHLSASGINAKSLVTYAGMEIVTSAAAGIALGLTELGRNASQSVARELVFSGVGKVVKPIKKFIGGVMRKSFGFVSN